MNRPREQESTDEKQAFCRRHRASMPRTHRRIKGGVALDGPLHRRGRPPRRPEFRSAFVGHLEWGQLATRRCRRRGCADATLGLGRGRGPVPAVTVEAAVADVVALLRDANIPFWIAGGFAIANPAARGYRRPDPARSRSRARLPSRRLGLPARSRRLAVALDAHPRSPCDLVSARALGTVELELLLADVVDDRWSFRRDPRISCPLADLGSITESGIPFVRPEIQLLFKAKNVRAKDEADFAAAWPLLDARARAWFIDALTLVDSSHAWLPTR